MGIGGGIVVYCMLWWIILFTVLPWGVKIEETPEQGHAPSAPSKPRIGLKFLITTGLASVAWGVVYWVIESEIIAIHAS